MKLLWLLAVPPTIFFFVVVFKALLWATIDRHESWWAFPLYMALAIPLVIIGMGSAVYVVFLAVG